MVKEILTFQTLWKWYEQPIVKNTISEYCKNRLIQLGSDPILRRYRDEAQTKPYWSPTPDEVVEWVKEAGLVGFLASITTLTAPCTKQRVQDMRPYVDTVDLIIDIDCRPGVTLEDVKNLVKYLQVPYKELGLLDVTFATNSRRSSNNLHIITHGKAIPPKVEGWDPDVLVGALSGWIVSRMREIIRRENPKLYELITPTAQKDASITIVPYHNLDRPFPVPLSLYWKPEKETGTFICPFPLTKIEEYDPSWASTETPNFHHKDCWKVKENPAINWGKLIEVLTLAKELKIQRKELEAGTWQSPQDIDLDKVRQAIKEERFNEVLCPGIVRAFTFPFGMGHRRPCLSVCHAYLRGIGFDDDVEIREILEKRNEKFDPPLEVPTLDKFFESESERFGEYYGPPGCKVMVHGGGAYFDGIQTLQLCEGRCDLSDSVTHPVWYTVRKIGGKKYERIKLCEITSFHCRKPLEAHVLISGVSASYRVPIWIEVKASQCAHDGNCPLLKGISSRFYVDDQVRFIDKGEGSQRTEATNMLVGRKCPEKLQCFKQNCGNFAIKLKMGTLTECFAMDAVDELRLDEKSITPRIVKIYVAREPPQPGSVAICQGTVGVLSRTSQLVFVADNLSEARKDIDSFDLERAKPFLTKTTMDDQVRLLQTATGAVGREDLLQAILLTYCSTLYIQWKNVTVPGWLITEIYGDTRTFKSEGAKRVRRLLNLGLYVSMETGGRTGILYTISQTKTGYIILWGELIYSDRAVLIIDGANRLKGEEWIEFREARSDGLVKVRRAAKGEAWCRVRQIFIRNPESGEALKNFAFRLQAIRYQPPDIARYDLFIPVWEEHVKEIIERPPLAVDKLDEIANRLRTIVLLCQSRKPEHVVFTEEAVKEIETQAKRFYEKYACSDFPIVSSDFDKKVAKLSASWAGATVSTDETFEKIIITKEIVEEACEWYDHVLTLNQLDEFAKIHRRMTDVSDEELNTILEDIKGDSYITDILDTLLKEGVVRRDVLAAGLGIHEKTVTEKMTILKKHRLVRSKPSGYQLTPRGIIAAKKVVMVAGVAGTEGPPSTNSSKNIPTYPSKRDNLDNQNNLSKEDRLKEDIIEWKPGETLGEALERKKMKKVKEVKQGDEEKRE